MRTAEKIFLVLDILIEYAEIASNPKCIEVYGKKFQEHGLSLYDVHTILKELAVEKYIEDLDSSDLVRKPPRDIFTGSVVSLSILNIGKLKAYRKRLEGKTTGDIKRKFPPKAWFLEEVENKAYLTLYKERVFEFPTLDSKKYRYLKCLWDHYGEKVDCKTIFEYQSEEIYPGGLKIYKQNANIRHVINSLRKELRNVQGLRIVTDKGFTLTLKS